MIAMLANHYINPTGGFLLGLPIAGGTIVFNGQNLLELSEDEMRKIRGNEISMIFQEPMTSLNPLHTVEKQINETLILHKGLTREDAYALVQGHAMEIWGQAAEAPVVPDALTTDMASTVKAAIPRFTLRCREFIKFPLHFTQRAVSSVSPVRTRTVRSIEATKIFPSPICPVRAAVWTTSMAFSTCSVGTTISILIFGRKLTAYSAPR